MATESTSAFARLSETQQKWLIRVVMFVFVLAVWEVLGRILGNLFLAPFSDVAREYVKLALDGPMFSALLVVIREMLFGYAIAVVIGVPVGLLMGRNEIVEDSLGPWVSALFVTATASMLPLFVILFGVDFAFRLAVIVVSCVWFILLNTYHGAKGVDRNYVDVGVAFDASSTKRFKDIVLPATLPYIFAGLRIGLIQALRGTILAETFIRFAYGGLITSYAQQTADTAPILAFIVTIVVFGYALRIVLQAIQVYLFPWADESGGASVGH
ncbi:MAG: ABC transporter permease [Salinigranum sp.]